MIIRDYDMGHKILSKEEIVEAYSSSQTIVADTSDTDHDIQEAAGPRCMEVT